MWSLPLGLPGPLTPGIPWRRPEGGPVVAPAASQAGLGGLPWFAPEFGPPAGAPRAGCSFLCPWRLTRVGDSVSLPASGEAGLTVTPSSRQVCDTQVRPQGPGWLVGGRWSLQRGSAQAPCSSGSLSAACSEQGEAMTASILCMREMGLPSIIALPELSYRNIRAGVSSQVLGKGRGGSGGGCPRASACPAVFKGSEKSCSEKIN